MFIHAVQRAVFQQQRRRGFLSHARNARNIIGAVAHQALEVDEAQRRKAVFVAEDLLVIQRCRRLPAARGYELHTDVFVDELQAVAVAGDDHAVPARRAAPPAHRADHIVRLPALAGVDGDVHRAQHVLHERHLHRQLLRHGVARRLVAVVAQMAERGRF